MASFVEDASILGKRERDEDGFASVDGPNSAPDANQDDSDDDVGPMPMPAGVPGTTKKKRKGIHTQDLPEWFADGPMHACSVAT